MTQWSQITGLSVLHHTSSHVHLGSQSPRWITAYWCDMIYFIGFLGSPILSWGKEWALCIDSNSQRKKSPVFPRWDWPHNCLLIRLSRQDSSLLLLLVCMGQSRTSYFDKIITHAFCLPDVNSANLVTIFWVGTEHGYTFWYQPLILLCFLP